MKLEKYFAGFRLISELDRKGLRTYPVKSGQAVSRGRMLGFSSGYVQQVTSIQAVQLAGISTDENTAGEASADGAVKAKVIPLTNGHQFAVPVEANALITQAAVGTIVDLQSANTIDINDAITLGWGFRIDAIDVSDEAIAANEYGFAIGHFEYVAAS